MAFKLTDVTVFNVIKLIIVVTILIALVLKLGVLTEIGNVLDATNLS